MRSHSGCSIATASSPVTARRRRTCPVVSPPSIPSCARWRIGGGSGGATSSKASAAPSSRCRVPSIDSVPAARRPATVVAGTFGERDVLLLAATDPANPYGVTLPWPSSGDDGARATFPRAAGAYVVLVDGDPVVYLERGGRAIRTLPAFARCRHRRARAAGPGHAGHRWTDAHAPGVAHRRRDDRRLAASGHAAGSRVRGGLPRAGASAPSPGDRVPEGDTLFRTATVLREVLLDRQVTAARARPGGAADGPGRGQPDRTRRCPGQASAHRLRCRADPPHASSDERFVAPLPTRRALAPEPGTCRVCHRGARCGRGLLRCAGGGAPRNARACHPPRPHGPWARTCWRPRPTSRRRWNASGRPTRRDTPVGEALARPASARRTRQRLSERAVLHRAGRSIPAGGRGGPGRARAVWSGTGSTLLHADR